MKLPLEFGTKLVFRLVIPGALLATAMAPLVHWALHASGVAIKLEYLFPVEVIAWGWVIIISDMHIYMLFEGRSYWITCMREWMVRREQQRLTDIEESLAKYRTYPPGGPTLRRPISQTEGRRRYLETSVQYSQFPIDEKGDASAPFPTRLGNLIASFEGYPNAVYGLDAVFYWYRLWVVLDKDLREEIDNAQALVDSTVYMTFILYVSALMMLFYALVGEAGANGVPILASIHIPYVPGPLTLLLLAIAGIVAGRILYKLSLPAHAQFGEYFKSLFDQHRDKLNFDDVVRSVGEISRSPHLMFKPQRERNRIVWRYLRWRRIRDDRTGQNKTVKDWR